METKVTCYYFFIKGVFGRNRKEKQELFYVKKYSPTKLDLETVKSLMNEKLKELKPKGEFTVKLIAREGTLKNDGGFETYTTQLMVDNALLLEKRVGY
mgnify:CR=1 FL=1|tara:strand:- start:69 stop:362 length:294 start_codon:yes stop_codon:yes gene_type:complete